MTDAVVDWPPDSSLNSATISNSPELILAAVDNQKDDKTDQPLIRNPCSIYSRSIEGMVYKKTIYLFWCFGLLVRRFGLVVRRFGLLVGRFSFLVWCFSLLVRCFSFLVGSFTLLIFFFAADWGCWTIQKSLEQTNWIFFLKIKSSYSIFNI